MKYLYTFILTTFLISCGTSSSYTSTPSTSDDTEQPSLTDEPVNDNNTSTTEENSTTENRASGPFSLDNYRTKLSDRYANRKNDIPESFLAIDDEEEEEKDLFEGYRIQIFSGQSINIADSVASQFRIWADTTIAGYQPETHVFFKPPFYRVHVGDFHTQERANSYAQLVKRRFKEAWVVYDRVNPWNVPADTARFTLIKNNRR